MKKKYYQFLIFLVYPLIDLFSVAFAIMASYIFYHIMEIGQGVVYEKIYILPISLLIGFVAVIIMHGFSAYKKQSSICNSEEIKNVISGITVTFILVIVILVFGKFTLSRYIIAFSYILSLFLLIIEKTIFYHFPLLTKYSRKLHKRILIYGAGEIGKVLYREIVNSPKLNIVPVGFIDDDPEKKNQIIYQSGFNNLTGLKIIGVREDIPRLLKSMDIDEVYVAISGSDYKTLTGILDFLQKKNVKAAFVPNLSKLFLHKLKINIIGRIPLVQEDNYAEMNYYTYIKPYIDSILVILAIILFWPLFLIISLAIKADSRGAVLFTHNRAGKQGKIFKLYKFRTMYDAADPYAINPLDQNDPRITRVGRFLRKTSLDELPQIINVLKGEMSCVGPRPEMPFIVSEYMDIHKERLKVLPGITGLWQLSGDRKRAIHENMDYDLYYIRNISLSLDIAIMIETFIFAFRGI
jgi:exopolysaccharide biosynthesis polyprenyl glycosylphosphotransferase